MADVHLNWLNWFQFVILKGDILAILIDYMIFLSPFLDVITMSMSKKNFLAQLDSGILCLYNVTYDLNGFKSTINIHLICRFFLNRFSVCFNLFVFLFLVTPFPIVAV